MGATIGLWTWSPWDHSEGRHKLGWDLKICPGRHWLASYCRHAKDLNLNLVYNRPMKRSRFNYNVFMGPPLALCFIVYGEPFFDMEISRIWQHKSAWSCAPISKHAPSTCNCLDLSTPITFYMSTNQHKSWIGKVHGPNKPIKWWVRARRMQTNACALSWPTSLAHAHLGKCHNQCESDSSAVMLSCAQIMSDLFIPKVVASRLRELM